MMNSLPHHLTVFGLTIDLIWQTIAIPSTAVATSSCEQQQFYLALPGLARFLALPEQHCIIIETAATDTPIHLLNSWLLGSVMAYILQYHDYLVLHGAAVLINDRAVIISGQSGAGKSTLAGALLQQGYPFITDDLVVIKRNLAGQCCIIPGPTQVKLWSDAMAHLNHDKQLATPVSLGRDKYAVPVTNYSTLAMIPIAAFYELNPNHEATTFTYERLTKTAALRTLMQNAYRYFMLNPLGKLSSFLNDCSQLAQQIGVNKIIRRFDLQELTEIIHYIELDQGVTL